MVFFLEFCSCLTEQELDFIPIDYHQRVIQYLSIYAICFENNLAFHTADEKWNTAIHECGTN